MILFPYSTALTLSRPPVVTYATALLCVLVFYAQLSSRAVTESLMYDPNSWNPLTMITSSLAHGDIFHLLGNMIFFMAFAPALELLIGSKRRYIWIMLLISFIVGISYSISVLIGNSKPWPSLGFSGVVMGMIGLSAYMMPKARIKVFWWYWFAWKTFYVPSWIVAVFFIGLDSWTLFMTADYGNINVVAHVAGGIAGYLYGYLRLKERREEIQDALAEEIQFMDVRRKYGKTREEAARSRKIFDENKARKEQQQAHDRFMGGVYQLVKTHRDSEAVSTLLTKYDIDTPTRELEALFEHIKDWGPSRTLLCLGRLIIEKLSREKRYGKAIVVIEKCQQASAQFVLPDIAFTLYYAEMAINTGKPEVAKLLLVNSEKRYGSMINHAQCNHLLQKAQRSGPGPA